MDIIALVGQVTKAETSLLMGEDFSGWKLRKDDPGTPGSTVRGMEERKRDSFILVCASLADVERAAQLLAFEGRARRMVVVVKETARPELIRIPAHAFQAGWDVAFRTHRNGFVLTVTAADHAVDIGQVAAGVVAPERRLHSSTRVAVQDVSLAGLVQPSRGPGIGMGSVSRAADSIPPFDVFLADAHQDGGVAADDAAILTSLGVPVQSIDLAATAAVDVRWASPVGFDAEPGKELVNLTLEKVKHRHLLTAAGDGASGTTFDVGRGVDENLTGVLRPYRAARLTLASPLEPAVVSRLLASLGCAGVPVSVEASPPGDLRGAANELLARFETLSGVDLSDNLARQQWSVGVRRWALQNYSQQRAWSAVTDARGLPAKPAAAVTVMIPSRRPEFVAAAVRQALGQSYPNLEIVVGLHGIDAGQILAREPWLKDHASVRLFQFDASLSLGQVLNQLTDKAGGEFLAKMDDDDLYTEHHIADLVLASEFSGAELVGCKAEFIYLEGSDLTVQLRPNSEVYGGSVTGGTILMPRHIIGDIGGWNPVGTAEDRLLQAGIRKAGGQTYRTHGLNYLMRRGDGDRTHTWNPQPDAFTKHAIRSWPGLGYPGWRTSSDV
ncbi:MAG: hypothetical protein JWQ75_224 [Pseudarthrobacter sp.]|nr:hypothetical protein [Pseudarthrobacter sp.]